jgi:MFS family permease
MIALRRRVEVSLLALRGVFANRNLRRVEVAYGGSAIGTYAFAMTVAVYAYRHGGTTAVGVVGAVRLAGAAAVAPFAASLADRLRRERVMLASDLGRFASVGACAVIVSLHSSSLAVYVLAVATSIFAATFRPAEASLLPEIARTPDELTAANITSSSFDSIGIFAGPALGAFMLALSGYTTAFALVALTFAWSALFVARLSPPRSARPTEEPSEVRHEGLSGMLAGFRAIRAEPRLSMLIGLYGAQCFVAGALGVLTVATALQLLGLGNGGVGVLQSACGIGAVLGAAIALALVGRARLAGDFGAGLVLWGAPLILIAAIPKVWVAALALGLVGIGNSLVDISAMTLIQRTAPPAVAGRVFGVLESAIVASLALGALVTPALIALEGVRGALLSVGALLPGLALLSRVQLAAIDDRSRAPQVQLDALRTVPFLAPLPLQSLEFLAARAVPVELAAGETLFQEGDDGDRFYVLDDGTLEVLLPDHVEVERSPGYVGEIALLREIPRTATVRASAPSHLWAVEGADFVTAVTGNGRARASAEDVVVGRLGAAPAA